MTFGFSLCAMPLLVAQVTYLGSGTWGLREWKTTRGWQGMLLPTLEKEC